MLEALQAGLEGPRARADARDSDADAGGLGPTRPRWLVEGLTVEVKMDEEGLHSSRYAARILEVREDDETVFVEFEAFDADEGDEDGGLADESAVATGSSGGAGRKLMEWVDMSRLWPPPPPPPPNFFERIAVGEPLELYLEDGWWEVSLQKSKTTPKSGVEYLVVSPLDQTTNWVTADRLRPRWQFVRRPNGNEYWLTEAPHGLVVWESTHDELPLAADQPADAPPLPPPLPSPPLPPPPLSERLSGGEACPPPGKPTHPAEAPLPPVASDESRSFMAADETEAPRRLGTC